MTTIPFDAFQDIWNIFLLVLVRITGMFFLSPVFGRRNIPNYFKVGFCFIFSVITANCQMPAMSYTSLTAYVVLIARASCRTHVEFISYLLFSSPHIAGQLIECVSDLVWYQCLIPYKCQIPVTADFYVIIATVMMLITDVITFNAGNGWPINFSSEETFNGEAIVIFKLFTVFCTGV